MAETKPIDRVCQFLGTGCGLGMIPVAPGSFGSLLGIPLFLLTRNWSGWLLVPAFIVFCLAAIGIADRMERHLKEQDPPCVVIDEIVGMWATFFFLWRDDWIILILGFIIFRALDISKVFPLNLFDSLRGGLGIVLDDLAAGMLANFLLRVILLTGIL